MSEHNEIILPKKTVESADDMMNSFIESVTAWQKRDGMLGYRNYTAEDRVALAYNLAWVTWNSWGGNLKYRFRPELIQRKMEHHFNILKTKDVGTGEKNEMIDFIVEMNSAMDAQEQTLCQVRDALSELISTVSMLQYEKNLYFLALAAIQQQFILMVKASDLPDSEVDNIMKRIKVINDVNLGQHDFVSVRKDMQDALEKAVANEKQDNQ